MKVENYIQTDLMKCIQHLMTLNLLPLTL